MPAFTRSTLDGPAILVSNWQRPHYCQRYNLASCIGPQWQDLKPHEALDLRPLPHSGCSACRKFVLKLHVNNCPCAPIVRSIVKVLNSNNPASATPMSREVASPEVCSIPCGAPLCTLVLPIYSWSASTSRQMRTLEHLGKVQQLLKDELADCRQPAAAC